MILGNRTVCKGATISGEPCVCVEERTENAHGQPYDIRILGIFADNELGHALADELVERLNAGKVRL